MKAFTKSRKRLLALALSLALVLALVPASAQDFSAQVVQAQSASEPTEIFKDTGAMARDVSNDHDSFTIPEDGGVWLYLTRPAEITGVNNAGIVFEISLIDSETDDVITSYRTTAATGSLESNGGAFYRVKAGQEVYVRVANVATRATTWSGFDYIVSATYVEEDGTHALKPNQTRAEATPIATDEAVNANLNTRDDVHWFVFELEETAGITITFSNPNLERSGSRWAVHVFTAEEFAQFDFLASSDVPIRTLPEKPHVLPAGTYYVRVRGGSTLSSSHEVLLGANFRLTVNTERVDFCRDCGGHDTCTCVETVPCWNCEADVFTPFCGECGSPVSGPPLPGDCGCTLHMLAVDRRPQIDDALAILRYIIGLPNKIDGSA
ncbi:MAG: hypothetical protein FWD35_03170 [Oscillospiraceae bacterium]|nr:hypothetical protein [Oscillospiraceae bacterium]